MSSQIVTDLGGLAPIGEKRKLLNHFVAKTEENQVNNILESSKNLPSAQYNLLKYLLADKFHRFDLIIELLYDGDSSIISAATSRQWLYEADTSAFIDSDFLINELFPNVSYNCRQKVLYRVGRHMRNESKADQIWNAVEEKYGFHVAFPLLQACTKDKINALITSRKVVLSGYQLVQVLKKHSDIGLQYLKENFNNIGSSANSYRSPLAYLYENHRDDFMDLCINHADKVNTFKFGRGRSTKIIRAYREKLLQKPEETSSLLKLDRIKREFSIQEFQIFFESSLSKTTPASHDMNEMWKWVKTVPINKRLEMIDRTFTKLYQINLDEQLELVDAEYIVLLPNEKRLSVVEWKSENDQSYGWSFRGLYTHYYRDEDKKRAWLSLKPASHSVPELQKLLLIEQDVAKRATLSKYLVETCFINNDLPQMRNVLELLNKRCRNDQSEVRVSIFEALDIIKNQMEFSKEHWDIIVEMLQISFVFADGRDYSHTNKERLLEKCIAFHLTSKLPLNNLVSMYIKLKIKTGVNTWTNEYIKNEADRRTFLVHCVKELENLQLTKDLCSHDGHVMEAQRSSEFISTLIVEICKFNQSIASVSPKKLEPILFSSNKWLKTSLEQIAKEEEERINKITNLSSHSWSFAKQLIKIIQSLRKEENLSLDAFNNTTEESILSKILNLSPCNSILMYFLTKNPSHLIENWSSILSKMLKSEPGLKFMENALKWNYSTITDQAIKTCNDIIDQTLDNDSEFTIKQKCNAVAVLSILSKPSEFLSFVERFYPTESKVDVFADNSKEDYQISQAIVKSLVRVTIPHATFPAIERFCVGDYLKLGVAALYSQTGRASEQKTLDFLRQKLIKSPVSLHKHIIRIYYVIGTVEQRTNAFKDIDSSNVSIRYEMFLRAQKLFRSTPSEQSWNILKNIIEKTTEEDASVILFIHSKPKLDTCPTEYISVYIDSCLTLLRKLKPEHLNDFMGHLEGVMDKIPEKTLDEIILYKNVDKISFNSSFCIKYINDSSTESIAEHRLSNMCQVLEHSVRNGWDIKIPRQYDPNSFDYPTRTSVFEFVSKMTCDMNDASKLWLKRKVLPALLEIFKGESVSKVFKEILYVELGLLLLNELEKSGADRLKSFGENLARFTDSLVEKYGAEIVLIINDVIQEFVTAVFYNYFNKNAGSIVELIDGILETSKTRTNQILSTYLLKSAYPKSSKLLAIYEKITKILNESDDLAVQMYNGWLTN